jgi:hypothetical protein
VAGAVAFVLMLALAGFVTWAMWFRDKPGPKEEPGRVPATTADLDLIPANAAGFVTLRMADAWDGDTVQAALQLSPETAGLTAQARKTFGLAPRDVERLSLVVTDYDAKEALLIVLTARPFDKDVLLAKFEGFAGRKLTEGKHNGKTYYQFQESGKDAFHFVSDRVFVLLTDKGLKPFLDRAPRKNAEGPLADALRLAASGDHHLVAALNTGADVPWVKDLRANLGVWAGPYLVLLDGKNTVLTMDLKKDLQMSLSATFPTEAKGKEAREAVVGVKLLARTGFDRAKGDGNLPPDGKRVLALAEEAFNTLEIEQKGTELRLRARVAVNRDDVAKGLQALVPLLKDANAPPPPSKEGKKDKP